MSKQGLFINFEGLDGCGKSTQLRLLAERLRERGYNVLETAEPGGTSIGMQIRHVVLDPANREMSPTTELLLYFAARAQNVDELIRPALERGMIVLTDRFTDSTRAYQGAARRLGSDVVDRLEDIACRGCVPDLTLWLDEKIETCLERSRSRRRDRMESEAAAFYSRVWEEYARLATREPERFRHIDAVGEISVVARRIDAEISRLLASRDLDRSLPHR